MDKLSSLNYKLPIKKKKKNRNLCLFILLCSLMFVTSLLLLVCSVLFIDNWKKAQNCLIYSTNYGNNSTFIIYLSIKNMNKIEPRLININFLVDKYKIDGYKFIDYPECWVTIVEGSKGIYIDNFTNRSKKKEVNLYINMMIISFIFLFVSASMLIFSLILYFVFRSKKNG